MILARMAKARDENKALMRPYTLTRNYKLFAKGNNQAKSEVTAEVTFVPPAKRTYKIVRKVSRLIFAPHKITMTFLPWKRSVALSRAARGTPAAPSIKR